MEINPGGKLSTNQIIGRDDDIARFWQVIQRQGSKLPAIRICAILAIICSSLAFEV